MTVEAIQVGITIVWNKEKYRNVYLTNKLCEELQMYCSDNNISEGPIFCGNKNSIDFSVSFYNYHEPSIYPCL